MSSLFRRPLLIYDDKCYSCAKFARATSTLSRGWIRIAGHYYSQEAIEAKSMIFPPGYDATKMFWLINRKGAYGARSGLPQLVREIASGIILGSREFGASSGDPAACRYDGAGVSCYTPTNVLRRLAGLLRNGVTFPFSD
jgi:hypothetical protein